MLVPNKSRNSTKEAEILSIIFFLMLCAQRQCRVAETEGKEISTNMMCLTLGIFSNFLYCGSYFADCSGHTLESC